jgi:prevent-host-death family protein
MNYARIGQLRNGLSRYLDQVREGGEVLVLDRDRPVARIVPAGASHPAAGGDSERLLDRPARVRGSVLADLRAERESGW